MRIEANLQYHPASFPPHLTTCQIEKVVELPDGEFSALLQYPMREHRFIAENLSYIVDKGGVIHSLMALGQGRPYPRGIRGVSAGGEKYHQQGTGSRGRVHHPTWNRAHRYGELVRLL